MSPPSALKVRATVPSCATVPFTPERLARLRDIEGWHFWFAGRRELVARLLRRHAGARLMALDLGCGTGGALDMLGTGAGQVIGLDLRPEGLADTRRRRPDGWLVQADAVRLPLRDATVDVITALDVLEHLDDEAALDEIHRVLRPCGVLLLTVPALPWLWSFRDRDAGHLRRYRRGDLVARVAAAGLRVVWLNHYQALLLPLVALTRLLGRKRPAWRDREEARLPVINGLLAGVSRLEARLSSFVSWPAGSSLVAVCARTEP
jgi:SAM-dependent methyltransferase